jgi:hypothetical protein
LVAQVRRRPSAGWSGRISPDGWALVALAAAVVLANLPYLLGLFDPNPLGPRSGLVSAVTPGVLGGQATLDPNNGVISQALSHRAVLDWFHLQLPWWNFYSGTGAPLAAEMQSAALFPLTILTAIGNGQLYEHMLLELMAGISTLLLLRRIGLSRPAAVAGAIAFALNGTFAWFGHATVNPVAFLPMLLLGIELALSAAVGGRRAGWWLIAVAGALSFYAGFPEVAYIDALPAIAWFAWRCSDLRGEQLRRFAGKAASGAIVATLLAAPLLIAMVGYFNHADLELHAGNVAGSLHLTPHALPQLLMPYIYGPIFGFADSDWGIVGGYLSSSLLFFGVLGLFSNRHRGLRLTLLIWLGLALARTYDQPHILGSLLGLVPGMSRVEFARYGFAAIEFPVAILCALGLDDLVRAPESRRRLIWAALVSLGIVLVAAIGARPFAHQLGSAFGHTAYYGLSVAWGVGAVLAAALAALVRDRKLRGLAAVAILAADALLLFALPELSAPRAVRTDLAPVAYLQRRLGQSRFMTLGPLGPNYGSYFGLASLNVSDGALPADFARYVRARLDPVVAPTLYTSRRELGRLFLPTTAQQLLRNLPAYRAAGVAFVLEPAGHALPQSATAFQLVFRSPSTWIYHVAGAAPYYTAGGSGCAVSPRGWESVRVSCPAPATLVRRETALPGWQATIDGRPVPVRKSGGLFQAVAVGPGRHLVSFSYQPPGIGWGAIAFVAGCGWLLVPAVARRLRKRPV